MKKTIPTTLAGTLFYIEEDAYGKLKEYLDSVKAHFAGYPESAEIISDIEARISEQFLESENKDKIVSLTDVEKIITSMGSVEDFSEEETANEEKPHEEWKGRFKNRKLFRNPDNVVIAGVASGIAAYFGIDPIIVRLLFVLVVLAGGSGVLIYIILWLIMPVARTSSDKLQMHGRAVTLEAVKDVFKEKVDEVKKNKGIFRKIIGFPFVAIGAILRFVLPLIQKLIGFTISFATAIAMFALTFAAVIAVFNMKSPYVDFPLLQMGHTVAIYVLLLAAFFAVFIPLLFVFSAGVRLLSRRNMWTTMSAASLLGVWFIALMSLGAAATRIVPEYQHFLETNPQYQDTTQQFDLKDFDSVTLQNNSHVTITEGDEFKVIATGWAQSIENATLEVKDGTLSIGQKNPFKICIFCLGRSPEISVTMPKLSHLSASNSSDVTATLNDDSVSVKLSNSSTAKLTLNTKKLDLVQENSSWASLTGTSTTATIKLSNSSDLRAFGFSIEDATISAENSSDADIFATKTLNATLKNSSDVTYKGSPAVTKKTSNSSDLKQENQNDSEDSSESF